MIAVIDIEHPHAPYIFAAVHHLGFIEEHLRNLTAEEGASRRFTFEMIVPSFEALSWIAFVGFQGCRPEAKEALNHIFVEAERLTNATRKEEAHRRMPREPHLPHPTSGRCCVCGSDLSLPDWGAVNSERQHRNPFCLSCIQPVRESIQAAFVAFGCDAI